LAAAASSPEGHDDEPGPKKSHTSFGSRRENPTKYNMKPGKSDKEVFRSFWFQYFDTFIEKVKKNPMI
jgi:hypothetical protein